MSVRVAFGSRTFAPTWFGTMLMLAAAVGVQPAAEVTPPLNLMHGLVLNQPLQNQRRRVPIDAPQDQKATVEPGSEQVNEVGVNA